MCYADKRSDLLALFSFRVSSGVTKVAVPAPNHPLPIRARNDAKSPGHGKRIMVFAGNDPPPARPPPQPSTPSNDAPPNAYSPSGSWTEPRAPRPHVRLRRPLRPGPGAGRAGGGGGLGAEPQGGQHICPLDDHFCYLPGHKGEQHGKIQTTVRARHAKAKPGRYAHRRAGVAAPKAARNDPN